MASTTAMSLVADIGGTNTRVALAHGGMVMADSVERLPNYAFDGLAPLLAHYLDTRDNPTCDSACVALAGPVSDGVGHMTNLKWVIDHAVVAGVSGAERVLVINDLQAQGYALAHLSEGAVETVIEGRHRPSPEDTKLVVGVGTGFNVAPVYRTPAAFVPGAEAGHMALAFPQGETRALLLRLEAELGFVSVEDVLSGRGLERLDRMVFQSRGAERHLKAAEIAAKASEGCAIATQALDVFAELLARTAGDLALSYLPLGGLYLVGGVARTAASHADKSLFSQHFCDKSRFSDFLSDFSVHLVCDDFAALTGAARLLANSAAQ